MDSNFRKFRQPVKRLPQTPPSPRKAPDDHLSENAVRKRMDDGQRRDALLLRALRTPPQPRPKREREKSVSPKGKKVKKTPDK